MAAGLGGDEVPCLERLEAWRGGKLLWADIDAATRTARLSDTKTGESIRPLSHAAISVIRTLPRSGDLVFSSADGKNLTALSRTVKRILQTAGLPGDISAHTLRHSLASVAADLGMSEPTMLFCSPPLIVSPMRSRAGWAAKKLAGRLLN